MEDATTGGSATVRAGVFNDGLLTLAPPAPIGITVTTASDAVFLVLPQPALIAVVKQFKARHQHPRQTKNSLASALTGWFWCAQGFEQYMVDSEGGKNEGAAKMNRSGSTVFKLGKLLAKEARKRIGGNTPRPLPSPTNAQQQPNRHHSLLNGGPNRPA